MEIWMYPVAVFLVAGLIGECYVIFKEGIK